MHEVFEAKDDMVLGIVESIPNGKLVFGLIVGVDEILNEGCELLFDVVSQSLFW